jgi:hypothetical protein
MSDWTKERLDSLISDQIEENLELEYKSAGSLARTNEKRDEITKDVSAFANSAGGVLIYGIRENGIAPERYDAVDRRKFSREWLEQVIQTIQPRLEGVTVQAVTIDHEEHFGCYVIEVPKSETAHMAADNRYYRRFNTCACPMQDYEVRDVMNRRKHPTIKSSIFINRNSNPLEGEGLLMVKISNVGTVIAKHTMVDLKMPVVVGIDLIPEEASFGADPDGPFVGVRMAPGIAWPPLFPGSVQVLKREMKRATVRGTSSSNREVRIRIFADEMPVLEKTVDYNIAAAGWVDL